ncbi:MAG: MFS transporter, partial [Pseudomonadales bacterium]
IESLGPDRQGAGAAAAIWGWHLGGTLVGGAGGLMLAEALSWSTAYGVFALVMGGALGLTLLSPEPPAPPRPEARGLGDQLRIAFFLPLKAFTRREGWALILIFIFVFKLGDALLGRMASIFYRELGFSLGEIAAVAKVYGLSANFVGIAVGGVLVARLGLYRALFAGGLAAAATNLGYAALAHLGQASLPFTIAVILDNFTGGLATVAFVAYLSSLCDRAYTATQYALLASLGNLARIWFSASAGALVDGLGGAWDQFFLLTTVLACAGLPLLVRLMRRYPLESVKEPRAHGRTD